VSLIFRNRRLAIVLLALIPASRSCSFIAGAQQVTPPLPGSLLAGRDISFDSTFPFPIARADKMPARSEATPPSAPPPISSDPANQNGTRLISPFKTSVEVNAARQTLEDGLAVPYHITQSEILSSAGTWGDFSRFLQLLPGAVWNSDMSNDVMVRGGSPSENLFVVDGIEVPNINHIAVEGTTGGFTSMIDTSIIESVDVKAGGYDARYSSRLSSLIEIHTSEGNAKERSGELDLGISGAGGLFEFPIGKHGSLLLSAHRSLLSLVTNDIGINGVPIYTDGMGRMNWAPTTNDRVSVLSLSGGDSIAITPQPCDYGVTLDVQTQYGGSRSTDGLVWQHVHGPKTVSTVTASYSGQNQNIGQQLQSTVYDNNQAECYSMPIQATPVYQEQSHDGSSTLSYGLQLDRHGWLFSTGVTGRLTTMNYAVAQPLGQQSPFNASSSWTDADNFSRKFASGQSATFAEVAGRIGNRWSVIGGAREETFALTSAHMFEPRVSTAFRINDRQAVNAAYQWSSQLAPAIDILSYAGNGSLRPIEVQQVSAGADIWRADWATVSLETYRKRYGNEPVSTEYPSLMLANMVDTLGQQFVWLPLKSGGRGLAQGVELLIHAHLSSRLLFLGSTSYSRTRYAAGDGTMRPGNFDFPLVSNGLATIRIPWKFEISLRDTYASGRPYTPFNIPLSEAQSRGIYDLNRVNAVRGPAYNRVDADFNRNFRIRRGILNIHAGVENALNRQNFLGYAWMDNCHPAAGAQYCGLNSNAQLGIPETAVTQMPLFPSAGIRYAF